MGSTLVLTGVACILAAIVGGGLKALGMEIPVIQSGKRQVALAALGVLIVIGGLIDLHPAAFKALIDKLVAPPQVTPTPGPTRTPTPTPSAGPSPAAIDPTPTPTPSRTPKAKPEPVPTEDWEDDSPDPDTIPVQKRYRVVFPGALKWVLIDNLNRRFDQNSKINTYIDGELFDTFHFTGSTAFSETKQRLLDEGVHTFLYQADAQSEGIKVTSECGGSFRVSQESAASRSVKLSFSKVEGHGVLTDCVLLLK